MYLPFSINVMVALHSSFVITAHEIFRKQSLSWSYNENWILQVIKQYSDKVLNMRHPFVI